MKDYLTDNSIINELINNLHRIKQKVINHNIEYTNKIEYETWCLNKYPEYLYTPYRYDFVITVNGITKRYYNKLVKSESLNTPFEKLPTKYDQKTKQLQIFVEAKHIYLNDLHDLISNIETITIKEKIEQSDFIRHCRLASCIVDEWPEYKKNTLAHTPHVYKPLDPQ